jgi:hypothetical protein
MLFLFGLLACEPTPKNTESTDAPAVESAPEPTKEKAAPPAKKEPVVESPTRKSIYISEIMAFPTKVDKFRGEWIEITNPTDKTVLLDGFSLQSKGDSGLTFETGTSIPAGGQLLLAVRKSPTGNGGLPKVDVVYKDSMLKLNATDWIELKQGDTVIERLEFEKGDLPSGKSLQFMPDKSKCEGSAPYGDGDFGTPGKSNQCG